MPVTVVCIPCNREIQVPDNYMDYYVSCPQCRRSLPLPDAPAVAPVTVEGPLATEALLHSPTVAPSQGFPCRIRVPSRWLPRFLSSMTAYPLRTYEPAGVTIQNGLLRVVTEGEYRQQHEIYCGALEDIAAIEPERLSRSYQLAVLAWRTLQLGLFFTLVLAVIYGFHQGWGQLWEDWLRRRDALVNLLGQAFLMAVLAAVLLLMVPGLLRTVPDLTRFNLMIRRRLLILYVATDQAGEVARVFRWANLPCPELTAHQAAERPRGLRRVLVYCAVVFVPMVVLMMLTNGHPLGNDEWVAIPVARQDLPAGTRLDGVHDGMLREKNVRTGQEPPDAVRSTTELKDWVLALPLPAGQHVTAGHLEPRTFSVVASIRGEKIQQGQRADILQVPANGLAPPEVLVGGLRVLRVEHFPDNTCLVDLEADFQQYSLLQQAKNNKKRIYVSRGEAR